MTKEAIKLKIENHKDIRRNVWTAIIVLTGGLAMLVLNLDSMTKLVVFIMGIILNYMFFKAIVYNNSQVEALIKSIEKEGL